jgi:hypothetical protein
VIFHLLGRFVSFTAYGDELVVLLTDAFFDAFGAVVFVFLLGADVTLHTALSVCESVAALSNNCVVVGLQLPIVHCDCNSENS